MAYTQFTDNENIISNVSIKPLPDDIATTVTYFYKRTFSDDGVYNRSALTSSSTQASFLGKDYEITLEMDFIRDDNTADLIANKILSRRSLLRYTISFSTIIAALQNDVLDEIDVSHFSGPSINNITINSLTINLDTLMVDIVGKTENSAYVILDENNLIILDENNRPILSE